MTKLEKMQRAAEMREMFLQGETMQRIGDKCGVTRQRVQQILRRDFGLTRKSGGKAIKTQRRREERRAARDVRFLEKYGIKYEEYKKILADSNLGAPVFLAFRNQRTAAKDRGIEWRLSFYEWLDIWIQSGKLSKRGRSRGKFCMRRHGDEGAYEPGNVYIGSFVGNSIEGRTLAHENARPHTALYKLVRLAGKRREVAKAVGVDPQYLSTLCVYGSVPKIWAEDGRLGKLLALIPCKSAADVEEILNRSGINNYRFQSTEEKAA